MKQNRYIDTVNALAEQLLAENKRWDMLVSLLQDGAAEYGRAIHVLKKIEVGVHPEYMRETAKEYLDQIV